VLYTERGVAAINGFLKLDPSVASRTVSGAAREAAWAKIAMVAQKAGVEGVPFRLPQAAQADPDDPAARRPAP